jgi:SAM-dependent methyltransferase
MPPTEPALPEPDQQVLIALSFLRAQGREASPTAMDEAGQRYFGMYRQDWTDALRRLLERGALRAEGDRWQASAEAQALGDQLRSENPKHRYFYNEFFTRTRNSSAHARFCERAYGRNLCQHGMMDIEQLDCLIRVLGLGPSSRVLELGCGNGLAAEYISDETGASVTGVDISDVGIAQAMARTEGKRSRLSFLAQDMLTLAFPPHAFDTLIAVDSLYFVPEPVNALDLARAIAPGGQMGIFYSVWAGAGEPMEKLRAEGNPLAAFLQARGLHYQAWDFTPQEAAHWQRKLQAVIELQDDFEAEDNRFLFNNRFVEADTHCREYVALGNIGRWLYRVTL